MAAHRAMGVLFAAGALLLVASPGAFAQPFPNLQAGATMTTSAASITQDGQNITVRCVYKSCCMHMPAMVGPRICKNMHVLAFDQHSMHPHLVSILHSLCLEKHIMCPLLLTGCQRHCNKAVGCTVPVCLLAHRLSEG